MDLRKLRRDPTELLTRAIQPALWLMVFGQVFAHARAIPTGDMPYEDFMAPGILAQSVLFIAIFYGISVIWERDLGIVHKLLVTPTPRTALVLGKGLSAGCRALSQAFIIYLLAWLLGVKLNWRPAGCGRRTHCGGAGRCLVFHVFADHRLLGEDARAIHGHRTGVDDADVLCEQRDLSSRDDAVVAQSGRVVQSAHLRS